MARESFIIEILLEDDGKATMVMSSNPEYNGKTISMLQVMGCRIAQYAKHIIDNPPKLRSTGESLSMDAMFEKKARAQLEAISGEKKS